MLGDPSHRSAHRAGPAGGLAVLTGQSLVRQAQAGQAIVRQALARRNESRQAPAGWAAPAGARCAAGPATPPDRRGTAYRASGRRPGTHGGPDPRAFHAPGLRDDSPTFIAAVGGQTADRLPGTHRGPDPRAGVGEQTADRLAEVWQAAAVQVAELTPDRAAPERAAGRRQPGAVPWSGAVAHQRHARRRVPREPQQTPQTLLRGLGALIVLAIVGLSAFFIVAEERRGDGRHSTAPPEAAAGIASREIDSEPLTQLEVFPEPAVRPAPGIADYQVTITHSDSVCRTATTGELGALLEDHGCDQVVRARLTAPYGGYQVTAGVFNLTDSRGAGRVSDLAGTLVESGRGSFATLGGSVDDPLTAPLAQVSWHNRGHYLLYCVVARPDGQLVTDDDPYAARISTELVQQYLAGQVVGQRTLDP